MTYPEPLAEAFKDIVSDWMDDNVGDDNVGAKAPSNQAPPSARYAPEIAELAAYLLDAVRDAREGRL